MKFHIIFVRSIVDCDIPIEIGWLRSVGRACVNEHLKVAVVYCLITSSDRHVISTQWEYRLTRVRNTQFDFHFYALPNTIRSKKHCNVVWIIPVEVWSKGIIFWINCSNYLYLDFVQSLKTGTVNMNFAQIKLNN